LKYRLAITSFQTAALLALRLATQATTLMLLARLLGPGEYGNVAAVASLAIVLGIVPNLGAGYVLLSRAGQPGAVADVWRYSWPLSQGLGATLLIIFVVCGELVVQSPSITISVLLLLGATELLVSPGTAMLSFSLQSREKVPLGQFVQWLPLGLRALATLPCFLFAESDRLIGYASLQFIAAIIGACIGLLVTRRIVVLDWRPRKATRQEVRTGISYAAMNVIAVNPSEMDKIASVHLVGPHEAGIYAAATRILSAAVMPVIAVLLSSQPSLFRHADAPTSEGSALVMKLAVVASAWGICSALLLVLARPVIPLLLGASFNEAASIMYWLAPASPFIALRLTSGTILVALGRPLERVGFELFGVGVLVAGMVLLAPTYGIHGMSIALISAEIAMSCLGWTLVVRRLRSDLATPIRS
jgi:O-antigen/teichoic acid export membrane protein